MPAPALASSSTSRHSAETSACQRLLGLAACAPALGRASGMRRGGGASIFQARSRQFQDGQTGSAIRWNWNLNMYLSRARGLRTGSRLHTRRSHRPIFLTGIVHALMPNVVVDDDDAAGLHLHA